MNKVDAKRKVAEQIANMLYNNVVYENGIEQFTGWCEDGDIFDGDSECIELMKKVAPHIDTISCLLDTVTE